MINGDESQKVISRSLENPVLIGYQGAIQPMSKIREESSDEESMASNNMQSPTISNTLDKGNSMF